MDRQTHTTRLQLWSLEFLSIAIIFLNGADLLFFTKPRGAGRGSGDPQLFIGSNEEVGIGTGDPACRLHVNCGANEEVARFESEDNDAFIRIKR